MKRRRALLLSLTFVIALGAACGVWLHRERQHYTLNRQLIDALEHNDTSTALALVNDGADPNTRVRATPAPTLKFLFSRLLHHLPLPVNDSPTAFHIACSTYYMVQGPFAPVGAFHESLPLLRAMLAHGADLRATTDHRQTALHNAAFVGRWHTVDLLLQHGADVNAPSDMNLTPLLLAACSDDANSVRLLMAHGANPNAEDTRGFTPLLFALNSKAATSMISELLTHGATPNLRNKTGRSPLDYARMRKRFDIIMLLKQHGAK